MNNAVIIIINEFDDLNHKQGCLCIDIGKLKIENFWKNILTTKTYTKDQTNVAFLPGRNHWLMISVILEMLHCSILICSIGIGF